MPEKNLISWSSMISMYSRRGFSEEAWLMFLDFTRCCNDSPNEYILASVIRATGQLDRGCGSVGKLMHGFIVKLGFDRDVFVGTSLVDFYAESDDLIEARMVFDGLLEKSAVTWTTIIRGYVRSGWSEVALQLFNQMREADIVPDRYVLSSVLSACSTLKFVQGGKQIHSYVLRVGIQMDVSLVNVLINFYAKSGKIQNARKLFDQMVDRDVISWTTMIAGYMQNSFDGEAVKLFVEMTRLGRKPDGFACTSILTSCGSLEDLMLGKQIHAYSIKVNLEFDLFLKNGLIDMYAKCDSLNDARRVFDFMTNHNVVSYNALIEGYSRSEQLSEVMILFHEMRHRTILPSLLTFVSLLSVSAALSALELSKQIHALTIKFGVCLQIFAGSALIDAYSKCLCLVDSRLVFDEMNEKDIVVWNAMFSGYTQQSEIDEALKLYSELQVSELKPSDFTFATFITLASNLASLQLGQQFHNHAIKMGLDCDPYITNSLIDMYAKCGSFEDARKAFGLVDDALRYFKLMPMFGGDPGIEHYACVVSLLCRAGLLYEAKEFIDKMPIKPTAAMWRSLLSACRIAGDIELAKYTAEKAISVDPNDSGSYTLLSYMFASEGKWEDVKQVRGRMDLVGLVKEPGHSWIQVNNEITQS
uniref:Pentacotripeptide-repeat region of PRORP domain-containing protein n=1 Tax=Manihot esculenta TaxID=3983 RepID=A0A2C9UY04_MANES